VVRGRSRSRRRGSVIISVLYFPCCDQLCNRAADKRGVTEEVHQIVYASKATKPLSPEELAAILETARFHNALDGITGMLLYRRGQFLQVLEGSEDRLSALLEKLNRDPRHHQVQTLLDARIPARAFGAWSMAFQDLSGLSPADLPGYSRFLTEGFSATECVRYPQKALRMLLAFRDTVPVR
jgi:hypothetical protein